MIGFLRGRVFDSGENWVILLIGGVGYKVVVGVDSPIRSMTQEVEVYVHTHVKEDELSLYGFVDKKALFMFELLIGVSGVGPKMAMNILGKGSAEQIQRAVAMADVGFFTSVKGIGKKNGQRIIVDLKSKLGDLADLDLDAESGGDELEEALIGMGFEKRKVSKVLAGIDLELSENERLKRAIKELSGG